MSDQDESPQLSDSAEFVSDIVSEEVEADNGLASNLYSQTGETKKQKTKCLMILFGEKYKEVLDQQPSAGLEGQNESVRVGGVNWTTVERQQFFRALSVNSQANLRAITESVNTKSEAEVFHFLCLLKDELASLESQPNYNSHITLADIPVSSEMSPNFEAILEQCADAEVAQQDRAEAKAGRKKYGGGWLVNIVEARQLDAKLRGQDHVLWDSPLLNESCSMWQPAITARGLFHFSPWIRLSERFFMNSRPTGDPGNWTTHAARNESPSSTLDVFADFHQLVEDYTRNLMQTTIYCISSRLSAAKATGSSSKLTMTAEDVDAATSPLGLPRDRFDFFTTLARRHKLQVVDHPEGVDPENGILLSLDEVEEALAAKSESCASAGLSGSFDHHQTSPYPAFPLRPADPGAVHPFDAPLHADSVDDAESETEESSGTDDEMSGVESEGGTVYNEEDTNSGSSMEISSDSSSNDDSESSDHSQHDQTLEAYDQTVSRQHEIALQNRLGLPSSS